MARCADEFVDWFEIVREDGRDSDVGLERHWIDPTKPLAAAVLAPAHGALITSATLRDTGGERRSWASAEVRTGAGHLAQPARRAHFGSPFKYEDQSRIFIVERCAAARTRRRWLRPIANCFWRPAAARWACSPPCARLREVGTRIAEPLAEAGLTLYAQHLDRLDTGALVDLFRAEENACLLGTDALRDGVDVPGRSLRLVVFDKVPWPKPTILHKARRAPIRQRL